MQGRSLGGVHLHLKLRRWQRTSLSHTQTVGNTEDFGAKNWPLDKIMEFK